MRKIGIFPAHIHQSAVIHHAGVPVGILVEGHTTHLACSRLISNHITHRIATIHAGHTLIADVTHRNDSSRGHISTIEELQIGLLGLNHLVHIRAITIHLIDAPALILVGSGKEDTLAIPVQQHIRHGGAVLRLIDCAALHLATQVRQLGNLGIETLARSRRLVRPVVILRTQRWSHHLASLITNTVTPYDYLRIVQQRVREQYLTL